jgi:hypothetical protein
MAIHRHVCMHAMLDESSPKSKAQSKDKVFSQKKHFGKFIKAIFANKN